MDKVVPLPGTTLSRLPDEAQMQVVEKLEELLAKAKRGEVAAFVFAGLNPGGWAFTCYRAGRQPMASIVGLAHTAAFEISHDWVDTPHPEDEPPKTS